MPNQLDYRKAWEWEVETRGTARAICTGFGPEGFEASGQSDAQFIRDTAAQYLNRPLEEANVLDYGCGVGRIALYLASYTRQYIGLDVCPAMIEGFHSRIRHPNATALLVGGESIDFGPAQEFDPFDLIISWYTLQHLRLVDAFRAVKIMGNMLTPGGLLLAQVANWNSAYHWGVFEQGAWEWQESTDPAIPLHAWTPDMVFLFVERAGLHLIDLVPQASRPRTGRKGMDQSDYMVAIITTQ